MFPTRRLIDRNGGERRTRSFMRPFYVFQRKDMADVLGNGILQFCRDVLRSRSWAKFREFCIDAEYGAILMHRATAFSSDDRNEGLSGVEESFQNAPMVHGEAECAPPP
jgi:hypothetical protein